VKTVGCLFQVFVDFAKQKTTINLIKFIDQSYKCAVSQAFINSTYIFAKEETAINFNQHESRQDG